MKNKKSTDDKFEAKLKQTRKEIDRIDKEIVERLNQRAHCVRKIGQLKEEFHESVYRPERENKILKNLESHLTELPQLSQSQLLNFKQPSEPLFPNEAIKTVFTEIISACRFLENPLQVGYLGPEGSFTHLATQCQFGHFVEMTPLKNFESIFKKIDEKEIDYGVIPLENSTDGMINQSIDLFTSYDVTICAELFLTIHLNLYSIDKRLSEIKKIYSHPQPFAQSKNWLFEHLPEARNIHATSTSDGAAKIIKEKHSACIASKQMMKIYPQLNCLAENIQDRSDNTTRFVVISQKSAKDKKVDEKSITSLMIFIKDKPGALYEILAILAKAKVNITNLVSRPSKRRAFDYLFYLDFIGDPQEVRIKKVLGNIDKYVVTYKVLGTYPRGMKYSS